MHKITSEIQIETSRLIISERQYDDLEPMHELYSNDAVMKYLPRIKTNSITETGQKLEDAISEIRTEKRKRYFSKWNP